MKNNKVMLTELKFLETKLKTNYVMNKAFKKLYERENKDKIEDNEEKAVIFCHNKGRDILSRISPDTIEFLKSKDFFISALFDSNDNSIAINDYFSLLETISCLVNILEYDLTEACF